MHNPVNDFSTAGESSNSGSSVYDEISSKLFADSQPVSPQSTPEINPFATAPSDQSFPSEDFNPFATFPSDQNTPSQQPLEVNPFATSPSESAQQRPKDIPVPGSTNSFDDFLDVDASILFDKQKIQTDKPKAQADLSTQAAIIMKQMKSNPELKEAYADKLKALANGENKLSEADILKMKANAKQFAPSEKQGPGAIEKELRELSTEKQRILDKNLNSETPRKFKGEDIKNGPVDDKTMQQKPLKKPESLKPEKPVKGEGSDSEDRTIQPKPLRKPESLKPEKPVKGEGSESEDRTIQPKPLRKPESIKPEITSEPLTNGEDEALREFEMNARSAAVDASNARGAENVLEDDDTDDGATDAAPEPAPERANLNVTGLGEKSEELTAVLNAQKEFTARTNDGSSFVQRADGTCILNSDEGRTKVTTDGTVTVTVKGVEQRFHFDNASREERHADGSVSYHFREGTTITELSANGAPRGLLIRQPNGTSLETNYAQPSQPRYRRASGK